jgi:hypothetical protein
MRYSNVIEVHTWIDQDRFGARTNIGTPVVITEAFGSYWHMDHPDLE